jgi:predicted transcriptional regulator
MGEYLQREMACEGLLDCFHGLKELDREVFGVLADAEGPMTVDEIAEVVDRERSTAYRSLKRLSDAGIVQKEQVNYDDGGYFHVFKLVPADQIANEMQRMLNEWYAQMGQLLGEFREKYDDTPTGTVPAEQ